MSALARAQPRHALRLLLDPCTRIHQREILIGGPQWQQISIFLSPMDVHVNRTPVSGRVTKVDFRKGKYLPAYHRDAAGHNERSEVWIDHGGTAIVFRQIVGILARRVVCRAKPGDNLGAGQRFGIMKFGSRMDVFVPMTATLLVKEGDKVVGGVTAIATLR